MSQLIKEIILPERINNYYLFSKIVVGVEIKKNSIIATKTRIQGTTSTIELVVEEKISEEVSEENFDRTTPTLKSIFGKIGSYDEIHTILSSSIVIFKELKLPFLTRDKISMVIGFEIEPLLPFSLRDAVVDFIITKQIPEEKSSEIIVTAVQKQHIIEHLALFEAAELKPDIITINMVSLYALYKEIPAYNQLTGGTALIDVNSYSTSIGLILNGQLKTVRTLPKGIVSLTKSVAQELNKSPNEVMENLLRFGLEATEGSEYGPALEKAFLQWWDSLNFTITSFTTQLLNKQQLTKIIFLGDGALIKGLIPAIAQKSGIACEQFSIASVAENKTLTINNSGSISPITIVSVSATLPLPLTMDYNLAQKEFITPDKSLLIKQIIVLLVLTLGLFTAFITHYSWQTNKLKKEIAASELEALTELKSTFKNLENAKTMSDALEDAEIELKLQKETWFAFSNQARASFLQYLLELASKIDKKSLDLDVEQITIAEGILTLKAKVRDHEALKILERELAQSDKFSYVEPVENPEFTMKIILATGSQENS